jgi:hypothetical protein
VSVTNRAAIANSIWVVFVIIQALDGGMTLLGVQAFGLEVEANPLIAWYAAAFGPAVAVIGAKLLAVGCGAVLHLAGNHRAIATMAVLYLLLAIGPWTHLLLFTPSV